MSTWHRTDERGIAVTFTYGPDARGNVTLTIQELEGLMRTGGWKPGPPRHPKSLSKTVPAIDATLGQISPMFR